MKKKVFNAMTIELQKRLSEIAGWVEEIKVDEIIKYITKRTKRSPILL